MSRKFFRILLRRRITIALMLILQLGFIIYLIASGSRYSIIIEYTFIVVSVLVVLHVVGESTDSAYKLIWVIQILIFPVFGGLFYLLFNYQASARRFQSALSQMEEKCKPLYVLPGDYYERACKDAPGHETQIRYLQKFAGYPIYGHTRTEYLSPGEAKFERLLEALKKAEKYIFLEYFSIQEGILWNTVLEILKEKAKNGVDVRIIYDDVGCFLLLPKDYTKRLREMGIKCEVFNPFRPFLSAMQNYRDHRKIAIVDGKIAITGGINLADEYINAKDKYGHWKDSAVMIEGEAAWSFTLIFLQMWAMCTNDVEDISTLYPWWSCECEIQDDGFVQPYADSPLDTERVGENVYLQIINSAKRYIYINTPYLVIDDSMVSALTLAAKSGVDVRIVTPHRGDKPYVQITTRSYYRELIRGGVKIYEYSNGFIHSKTFVSDDKIATVGSANLDYRSLYLSFECGVWMYECNAVRETCEDFMNTLERCHQITEQDCENGRIYRIVQNVLRLLAPLM